MIFLFRLFCILFYYLIVCKSEKLNEIEVQTEELSTPLKLKSFLSNNSLKFKNLKFKYDVQFYSTKINSNRYNKYIVSYYLTNNNGPCRFKYRFVKTMLSILVKRGELLGSIYCNNNKDEELPVLSYCYGEVQLSYPYYPNRVIILSLNEIFLFQNCAPKFPDYRGIPYTFPKIPLDQYNPFNNTLFEMKESKKINSENEYIKTISYYMRKQMIFKECVVSRFISEKIFETTSFSIIGVITCQTRRNNSEKRLIRREIIRSLCNGISSFNISSNDYVYGIFHINSESPFLNINCTFVLEKSLNRVLDPDKFIRDTTYFLKNKIE